MSLVSIIIPCYNSEQFIKRTIESVLKQTYSAIEVIIVNDGSTDNSVKLIQSFKSKKVKIFSKPNTGVASARNFGFQQSSGKYLLFLDADDLITLSFIEAGVDILDHNLSIDFCTSSIVYIDEFDKPINTLPTKKGTYKSIQMDIASFKTDVSSCPSNYLYRKSALLNKEIKYSTCLQSTADKHFLFQVGNKKLKGALINPNLAHLKYRVSSGSMSQVINEKLLLEQEKFYEVTIADKLLKDEALKIFQKKMAYQLVSTFIRLRQPVKVIKYLFLYLRASI